MRSLSTARLPVTCVLVLLSFCGAALAADDEDPPDRVARVSLTEGAVSLEPAGSQDWANADVNRPLTTGDKLWTDDNSRVELDIGSAAIRLGPTTGFSFLNLDDQATQMQLTAGTVIVRIRTLGEGESFEVDTPNLALSLTQPGQYRVEVNDAGDTTVVKVSEGEAQAAAGDQGFPLHAQQKATFAGTTQLSSVVSSLGAPDDLDSWSLTRDRQARNAQSQQYVSTEATGYADLDNNGRWENTPDYGYVWTPTTVVADWAPYRFGHWVWITPWGWTWVDDASWGFAPFHYGRWVSVRNSWCWVPGPRRVRPVYAPALVAWVGGPAAGVSVAVGGGVGWFPLGPREVYVPAYRASPRYVERVNISNTTIVDRTYITNVYQNRVTNITYANRNVRGAVTNVQQNVFVSAQPVGRNRIQVPEGELRNFALRGAAPNIAPTRQSLVGSDARRNVRQPPPTFINRQVVVRTSPPRPAVPFDRQSEAIRANGGRPIGRDELSRMQPNTPGTPVRVADPNRNGFRPGTGGNPGGNRPQQGQQGQPGQRGQQSQPGGIPDRGQAGQAGRQGGAPDRSPPGRQGGLPNGQPPGPAPGHQPAPQAGQQGSLADRDRALRENHPLPSPDENRAPAQSRQGLRNDRPHAPLPGPGPDNRAQDNRAQQIGPQVARPQENRAPDNRVPDVRQQNNDRPALEQRPPQDQQGAQRQQELQRLQDVQRQQEAQRLQNAQRQQDVQRQQEAQRSQQAQLQQNLQRQQEAQRQQQQQLQETQRQQETQRLQDVQRQQESQRQQNNRPFDRERPQVRPVQAPPIQQAPPTQPPPVAPRVEQQRPIPQQQPQVQQRPAPAPAPRPEVKARPERQERSKLPDAPH